MYPQANKYYQNAYSSDAIENSPTKNVFIYGIGSILILGVTFFVGRKLIRDLIKKNEEQGSFEDESIAGFAKAIKMAFDNDGWWGTDTNALRNTLQSIPNKDVFNKVTKSYQRLYNKSLMSDMQAELNISTYNEMLAIINGKASSKNGQVYLTNKNYEAWAKRLKSAFDKTHGFLPATDEEAISAVFTEIPTQKAFKQVAIAYQVIYNHNLISDLKSELEFWEYKPMIQLIANKPQ
jgi:hypothetical protein